jgi:hypothetical protein
VIAAISPERRTLKHDSAARLKRRGRLSCSDMSRRCAYCSVRVWICSAA